MSYNKPVPGPPRLDFTITYGATLTRRLSKRDKDTKAPIPYADGATAHVRFGGSRQKGEVIPLVIDGNAVIFHVDSEILDTFTSSTPFQIIVTGDPSIDPAVLVGSLVRG